MKKIISFLFRCACSIVLMFWCVISFIASKMFADEHSAWFIVAVVVCIASFIGAIAVFNGNDTNRIARHTTITKAARHTAELNTKNAAV